MHVGAYDPDRREYYVARRWGPTPTYNWVAASELAPSDFGAAVSFHDHRWKDVDTGLLTRADLTRLSRQTKRARYAETPPARLPERIKKWRHQARATRSQSGGKPTPPWAQKGYPSATSQGDTLYHHLAITLDEFVSPHNWPVSLTAAELAYVPHMMEVYPEAITRQFSAGGYEQIHTMATTDQPVTGTLIDWYIEAADNVLPVGSHLDLLPTSQVYLLLRGDAPRAVRDATPTDGRTIGIPCYHASAVGHRGVGHWTLLVATLRELPGKWHVDCVELDSLATADERPQTVRVAKAVKQFWAGKLAGQPKSKVSWGLHSAISNALQLPSLTECGVYVMLWIRGLVRWAANPTLLSLAKELDPPPVEGLPSCRVLLVAELLGRSPSNAYLERRAAPIVWDRVEANLRCGATSATANPHVIIPTPCRKPSDWNPTRFSSITVHSSPPRSPSPPPAVEKDPEPEANPDATPLNRLAGVARRLARHCLDHPNDEGYRAAHTAALCELFTEWLARQRIPLKVTGGVVGPESIFAAVAKGIGAHGDVLRAAVMGFARLHPNWTAGTCVLHAGAA